MAKKFISAVPNISEGRDTAFIDGLAKQLEKVPGLMLMDVAMDQARNRTIFSLLGGRDAIFEGGFIVYEASINKIDMRKHEGAYPRIGAVDAFPFVAIQQNLLEEAIGWANEFGSEVGERYSLPVYLSGDAAKTPMRRELESIREGEYEGFAAKMQDPAWQPDFGPNTFPVDRGATIVTARLPLVNLKVYLTTNNELAAKWVADVLSGISNGFPDVRLYPGLDTTCNLAFLNITVRNYSAMPLYRVFEAIKTELRRFGASIRGVQTVGLVPQSAFIDTALHYLLISDFSYDDVLETRMEQIFHTEE
jgi:glutamate formiminotransferase